MSLKLGILIIGSLYWSTVPYRALWRKERLRVNDVIPVFAPIRYGRLSRSRTYTMVFAPGCPLGTAKVVPCAKEATSFSDVFEEAKELWIAECSAGTEQTDRACISASWGCVAMLPNPTSQMPGRISNEWAERVSRERTKNGYPTYSENGFLIDGQSAMNERGVLQIPWPTRTDTSMSLSGIDLLLATATRPKFASEAAEFPNENTIASAWRAYEKEAKYFRSNRADGIYTFQDAGIEKLLTSS